jgi:imidazolonepropionase-like amidohydrolase
VRMDAASGNGGGDLAVTNVTVVPSPDAEPIEGAIVVAIRGRIAAVGRDVSPPTGVPVLDGNGSVLTAGFWNAHIHLTERKWARSARAPADQLNRQLGDMLTSRGFTTVVDCGSDPRSTMPLRRRIASGELAGPAIYTAGPGLYPPKGIPYYLRDSVPFYIRWRMPQPRTRRAARRLVRRNIGWGSDLLKLFTGSYVAPGRVLPMPGPLAQAAVEVAHAHGQVAFAHASNLAGTRVALESGVDVLAHAPDSPEGIDDPLLRQLVARGMRMIPTLKMFQSTVTRDLTYLGPIYGLVRRFRELGGVVLFGTDVGYMTDYATEEEFEALRESGLDGREILRALTTTPSERFGVLTRTGTVGVGKAADLVLVDGDPLSDPIAFAHVRHTIRSGRVVWSR